MDKMKKGGAFIFFTVPCYVAPPSLQKLKKIKENRPKGVVFSFLLERQYIVRGGESHNNSSSNNNNNKPRTCLRVSLPSKVPFITQFRFTKGPKSHAASNSNKIAPMQKKKRAS
jgi:hypothetical protein